jgi:hypothetical protein
VSGLSDVAQISNLPYRRIGFGRAGHANVHFNADAFRVANPRYSRVQLCAILVAATPRRAIRGQKISPGGDTFCRPISFRSMWPFNGKTENKTKLRL